VRPHKADVSARDHLKDVAREQYAATFPPVCPVQGGVSKWPPSRTPARGPVRLAWCPPRTAPRGPPASRPRVGGLGLPRTRGSTPPSWCVVRLGDRDRRDAAQALQQIYCGVVYQGKAPTARCRPACTQGSRAARCWLTAQPGTCRRRSEEQERVLYRGCIPALSFSKLSLSPIQRLSPSGSLM
jgi:hypothetical protein